MAKELPYFKFEPGAWDNGNIQMVDRELKGLFIDLCSLYWSRLGDVPLKLAALKLCGGNATALESLCDEDIIAIEDGLICIDFLELQLSEFKDLSETNRKNARDGWEKRRKAKKVSDRNATAYDSQSETDAIREEKRREEKRKEDIPPTPLKGESDLSKKVELVSFDKTETKKTPRPKFEPDYSGMEPEVEQAFREFNEFRRTKRKAWGSQIEFERFVEKLRKLSNESFNTAKEILNESIANGWVGIFELKTNQRNGKNQPSHEQRVEKSLDTANIAIQYVEREAARKAESERRRSEPGGN
jgi:hypothetical protein